MGTLRRGLNHLTGYYATFYPHGYHRPPGRGDAEVVAPPVLPPPRLYPSEAPSDPDVRGPHEILGGGQGAPSEILRLDGAARGSKDAKSVSRVNGGQIIETRAEEDSTRVRADLILLVLAMAAVLALRLSVQGFWNEPWVKQGDMVFSADIARNLALGRGYVENRILPRMVMAGLPMPTPFATKGLLHPLLSSLFFLSFGISDHVNFLTSLPFTLLTVVPLYRFGRRLGGRPLALLIPCLWTADPWTAELALSGLREPLYAWPWPKDESRRRTDLRAGPFKLTCGAM